MRSSAGGVTLLGRGSSEHAKTVIKTVHSSALNAENFMVSNPLTGAEYRTGVQGLSRDYSGVSRLGSSRALLNLDFGMTLIEKSMQEPEYWSAAKAHLQAVDSKLGAVIRQYEDPPLRSKRRPFETLCNAIVGQQISAVAAAAVWARATREVGEWTPQAVLNQDASALRATGLSTRKVEYLIGVSQVWPDPRTRYFC